MYILEKTFTFEAGHVLEHHDGKCATPHGHSYILTIQLKGNTLQQTGPKKNMMTDFQDISTIVKGLIKEKLDHKWLNEMLDSDSPTCEFIAKWIFDQLKPSLPFLVAVILQETATSKVIYSPSL